MDFLSGGTKKSGRCREVARGGGDSHMKQTGCSLDILNSTPKGDHWGVAQAFCDP